MSPRIEQIESAFERMERALNVLEAVPEDQLFLMHAQHQRLWSIHDRLYKVIINLIGRGRDQSMHES